MSRTRAASNKADKPAVDWADPGYFSGSSVIGNTARLLVQLIHPPRGHRTVPTKTGSVLIFLTIGVGTAAFNTGQNILYLALALMLSTLLVSGILSWLNFKGCRWRLEAGRHFRVGEASPVYLEIRNDKRRLPSYDLIFYLLAALSESTQPLVLNERLGPGGMKRLLWEFTPRRRGEESIRLDGMVSRYPFGFLRKTIRDSFEKSVTVWPGRVPYQFNAGRSGGRQAFGQQRKRGDGVELIHLRQYRSGDSLRRIHWKASARMGSLQVRETEQDHHQSFVLCIDPSPRIWSDEAGFEKLCSFVASLAEDLYQKDQLRGLQVAGLGGIPVAGIEDLYRCLDTLACLKPVAPEQGDGVFSLTRDAVTFIPGAGGTVIARLEQKNVGQA